MFRTLLLLVVALASFDPHRGNAIAKASASGKPLKSVVSNKKVVVVGGGPVALYFAALLLQSDPSVQIEILEKHQNQQVSNAFGMGIGERMEHRLKDVPGLYEKATSVSSVVESLNIPLVSRDDLVNNMRDLLKERHDLKVALGDGCSSVDFSTKTVTTDSGRRVRYDLLVGADGVNSKIRRFLIDQEKAPLGEKHYHEDVHWKALQIPKQPNLEESSFRALQHPAILVGRVLPKAPEGHFLMLVWKGNQHDPATDNPIGIRTKEDWKKLLNDGIQQKSKNPIRKLFGMEKENKRETNHREFVFDEDTLTDFVNSRAKPSHHLQLERYHYSEGSVVLIGDSAHSFNSLMGQGCATGLECARVLVDFLLQEKTSLGAALSGYTEKATVESHAMTEISLINYAVRGGSKRVTIQAISLILWNMLRGKGLIKRIRDINVPFSVIAQENKRLLSLCRKEFEKERKPVVRAK